MTEQEQYTDLYKRQLETLIACAKHHGVVLTVTLKPTDPLRMGGYEMVADVRPARVQS